MGGLPLWLWDCLYLLLLLLFLMVALLFFVSLLFRFFGHAQYSQGIACGVKAASKILQPVNIGLLAEIGIVSYLMGELISNSTKTLQLIIIRCPC